MLDTTLCTKQYKNVVFHHPIAGDLFPSSLRYYDLRLRYATSVARAAAEQDLGRACRWVKKTDMSSLPIVIVSSYFYKQLASGRGRCAGLLQCPADPDKMRQFTRTIDGSARPDDEFATECYRHHFRAKPGHFDAGRDGRVPAWRDNPMRFLLFGRPQIGETGVFHHLSYLLWE